MTEQPKAGELLVGAYFRLVKQCDLVMYNQRSPEQGEQMEVDIIAVKSNDSGGQDVYICEVTTHLGGIRYGTIQESFERFQNKFESDRKYITKLFKNADTYKFQLWSPAVTIGLEERFPELETIFEDREDMELDFIVNKEYTSRIKELQENAGSTTKQYNELGIRLLQILGHLK